MDLEHVNNRILHYDGLIWTVTSILLAANSLLINALIQAKERWQKILISLLGVLLTMATVYFAASFRNWVAGFSKYYREKIREKDEVLPEEKIHDSALGQWLFYVIVFCLIGCFWTLWPVFLSKKYWLPCSIGFSIVVGIFFILFEKGNYCFNREFKE